MTQTPSFLDLGVSRPVVDALARNQILAPFAIQALVMGDALAVALLEARGFTADVEVMLAGGKVVSVRGGHAPAAARAGASA